MLFIYLFWPSLLLISSIINIFNLISDLSVFKFNILLFIIFTWLVTSVFCFSELFPYLLILDIFFFFWHLFNFSIGFFAKYDFNQLLQGLYYESSNLHNLFGINIITFHVKCRKSNNSVVHLCHSIILYSIVIQGISL